MLKTVPFTCGQKPIKYDLPVSKSRLVPTLTQPAQAFREVSQETLRKSTSRGAARPKGLTPSTDLPGLVPHGAAQQSSPRPRGPPHTHPGEEKLPGVRGAAHKPHGAPRGARSRPAASHRPTSGDLA